MVVGGLGHTGKRGNFGQDRLKEARAAEQLEGTARRALGEQLDDLLADALPGDLGDGRRLAAYGSRRRRVDLEAEPGREPHGADHAQAIFSQACARIADGAHDPRPQVRLASHVVDHSRADGIEEEPVDGKVPPAGICLGVAEMHGHRVAPVEVDAIGAEGRHLDLRPLQQDEDHPELDADRHRVRKQLLDAGRRRAGGNVVVERLTTEQLVADAAPGKVRLETRLPEAAHDARRLVAERLHGPTNSYPHCWRLARSAPAPSAPPSAEPASPRLVFRTPGAHGRMGSRDRQAPPAPARLMTRRDTPPFAPYRPALSCPPEPPFGLAVLALDNDSQNRLV